MRQAISILSLVLLAGCATAPSKQGVLFRGPEGASVAVNGVLVGTITDQGLAYLPADNTLAVVAYKSGFLPTRVTIHAPFPAALVLSLEPGPDYFRDVFAQQGIRFVQRGPDLLMLEPANRPVTLRSSYRVFMPRKQEEILLYVAEINKLYVVLKTDDGVSIAVPILHPS